MNKVLLATTVLAGAAVGLAYSASLSATGGTGPYTFQLTGGALPDGVSLFAAGTISGTPSVDAEGTSTFTVTATDVNGDVSDPVELSIDVSAAQTEAEPAPEPAAEIEPAAETEAAPSAAHGLLDEIEGKISELREHVVDAADQAIADAENALKCAHDELVAAVAKMRQALTGAAS